MCRLAGFKILPGSIVHIHLKFILIRLIAQIRPVTCLPGTVGIFVDRTETKFLYTVTVCNHYCTIFTQTQSGRLVAIIPPFHSQVAKITDIRDHDALYLFAGEQGVEFYFHSHIFISLFPARVTAVPREVKFIQHLIIFRLFERGSRISGYGIPVFQYRLIIFIDVRSCEAVFLTVAGSQCQ